MRAWPGLIVDGGRRPLATADEITVPGDKSITHRALISAVMTGASPRIRGANTGAAVLHLLEPMGMLGYNVRRHGTTMSVRYSAANVQACPRLDVRESSAAARLLIGVLAGRGIRGVVDGDRILRTRPMDWVVDPLRALGAGIGYLGEPGCLPVEVRSPVTRGGRVALTVGSAQARSAVLTACASAGIAVRIERSVRSRDHSERLLMAMGADVAQDGSAVTYGGAPIRPLPVIDVPGDPSLAAYPAAAELLAPTPSGLRIRDVCLNPTRVGFFEVLRDAGARIAYENERQHHGEPVGDIVVLGGLDAVRPAVVDDPFTLHSLIDEVPLLAAVATRIAGVTVIGCAKELAFKETNRLETTTSMLRAFGATITQTPSGLRIDGGAPLRPGRAPSFGDHRLGMAAATLAATLPGTTVVDSGMCHTTSFPGFADVMNAVGLNMRAEHG